MHHSTDWVTLSGIDKGNVVNMEREQKNVFVLIYSEGNNQIVIVVL